MKKIIVYISLLAAAISLLSCGEDKLTERQTIIGLGGDDEVKNQIDEWIDAAYTKPYNMTVKYRWDRSEADNTHTFVPVREELVIPVMSAIKQAWIVPFETLGGGKFIKNLSPKMFVLVGSAKYTNGSIVTGEAEGGRKIVIYRLNWYNTGDIDILQSMLKTVHHEFAHTMHAVTKYPQEYEMITKGSYTSEWTNQSYVNALKHGYISSYAMASANEDFAEMIARICVYGREAFDAQVAQASAYYTDPVEGKGLEYDPAAALRSKEAIIINYLKTVWGINFYDQIDGAEGGEIPDSEKGLVTWVQEAIAEIRANTNN